jgi:hypothetical protein
MHREMGDSVGNKAMCAQRTQAWGFTAQEGGKSRCVRKEEKTRYLNQRHC